MNSGRFSFKTKYIFCHIISLLWICQIQAKIYNMQELGADHTGKIACTALIHQSIQKAAAEGGGTIYFSAGEYLTGALHLKNNITIHIESGAVIRFSDNFDDYLPFVQMRWAGTVMKSFSPLFYAINAENLTICGRGKIDGQGAKWWAELGRLKHITDDNHPLTKYQQMWIDANPGFPPSPTLESFNQKKFYRPSCIQLFQCKDIRIEGITIVDSPFWTINPEFCDNITIDGVTIKNPPANAPNTDGINPSSCSNVHISNCHLETGDDCIVIKSGLDADGRKWGKPSKNITITNCTMLAGHGGVVIGSEMSGDVRNITIANCVFDGTNIGIRMKSARGRGGVVEGIRVNNIVMNNIRNNAFEIDLLYSFSDGSKNPEPVSERTPIFRNIHISNITGININRIGLIRGIEEMPVGEVSFNNINMAGNEGFRAMTARNIQFHNVDFAVIKGASFDIANCKDIVFNNVRSKTPITGQPVILINNTKNVFINNCFPIVPTDIFCESKDSELIWGNNYFNHVKTKPKI